MAAPERIEFLSAVLLYSRQPDRMATFYRDVLGVPLREERHGDDPAHWGCELGDVHFAIHPAEDKDDDRGHDRGPVRLAFWVFDLESFVEYLDRDHGVSTLSPIVDLGESSLLTVVNDPDGNEIELTQMGPTWVAHLDQHRQAGADVIARATVDHQS
jgi:catechol 2,3-dioxygenase-like lactoylglutathione lyase family enzyme